MKPVTRVTLTLLAVLLLAAGTIFIIFSWRHLQGSDDAELAGWCVVLGLGLSAAAAFLAESVIFPKPPRPTQFASQPLRFVILHHELADEAHFDVMMETSPGSLLATWRAPRWPIDQGAELLQLPDHRREYLTYEGEISGGRGRVRQVAAGSCEVTPIPDGGIRVRWDEPDIAPLMLRRIEGNRWSGRGIEGAS